MNEGGQSSTGQVGFSHPLPTYLSIRPYQLIDFILTTHPAYPELQERAKAQGKNIFVGE
jgi:ribulose kinase